MNNNTLKKLGFKLKDGEDYVHPDNESIGFWFDKEEEESILFVSERGNYHGLRFRGIASKKDIRTLWLLINGEELSL